MSIQTVGRVSKCIMRAKNPITYILLLQLGLASFAFAQSSKSVEVDVFGSAYVRTGQPIARVSVGSTQIADVAAFPPDQLVISGKRVGQTTATVFSKNDEVTVIDIAVGYPVDKMTAAVRKAIPDGVDLQVTQAGTAVAIAGEVPSVAAVEQAERLIKGFLAASGPSSGALSVLNLLSVAGDQQVQLEVSFAEVSRTALKEMGFNFWHKAQNGNYTGGITSSTTPQTGLSTLLGDTDNQGLLQNSGGLPAIATPLSGTFGLSIATAIGTGFPFTAALSLLASKGYSRTLAEPTLVALSGKSASFLAGGEIPIPLASALGQVSVDYKKFGIQLEFVPTVVGDSVQLTLATTVSDIDAALGVRISSLTIPGLTSRHSSTTIRLQDGQSFAIAGLLSDKVRSTVDKLPGLGDLPVLGALFRSTNYRRDETELLIVVTARLVRPQDDRPRVPGEKTLTDPSDLELFLFGAHESKPTLEPADRKRKTPAGPVGFAR